MKKVMYFFAIFFAMVGGVGSVGYLVWLKEWVVALGALIVCIAAFPTIKGWMHKMMYE